MPYENILKFTPYTPSVLIQSDNQTFVHSSSTVLQLVLHHHHPCVFFVGLCFLVIHKEWMHCITPILVAFVISIIVMSFLQQIKHVIDIFIKIFFIPNTSPFLVAHQWFDKLLQEKKNSITYKYLYTCVHHYQSIRVHNFCYVHMYAIVFVHLYA